jgi:hypothetical protein
LQDLSALEADELRERFLVLAQTISEASNELAASRCGDGPELLERCASALHRRRAGVRVIAADVCEHAAVDRRTHRERAAPDVFGAQT